MIQRRRRTGKGRAERLLELSVAVRGRVFGQPLQPSPGGRGHRDLAPPGPRRRKLWERGRSWCHSSSEWPGHSKLQRVKGCDSGGFGLSCFVETPPLSVSSEAPGGRGCRNFPVRGQWGVLMLLTSEGEHDPVGLDSAPPTLLVPSLTFSGFSPWKLCEDSVPDQVWDFQWLTFWDLLIIFFERKSSSQMRAGEGLMVLCSWKPMCVPTVLVPGNCLVNPA